LEISAIQLGQFVQELHAQYAATLPGEAATTVKGGASGRVTDPHVYKLLGV
jgi:hypothetical protein